MAKKSLADRVETVHAEMPTISSVFADVIGKSTSLGPPSVMRDEEFKLEKEEEEDEPF